MFMHTLTSILLLLAEAEPPANNANAPWWIAAISTALSTGGSLVYGWYKTRKTAEHKDKEVQADRKKEEAEAALKRAEEERKKAESLAEIELRRLAYVFNEMKESIRRARSELDDDRANAAAARTAAAAQIDKLQEDLAKINEEHGRCREDNAKLVERSTNQERRLGELEQILQSRGLLRRPPEDSSNSTLIVRPKELPPTETP